MSLRGAMLTMGQPETSRVCSLVISFKGVRSFTFVRLISRKVNGIAASGERSLIGVFAMRISTSFMPVSGARLAIGALLAMNDIKGLPRRGVRSRTKESFRTILTNGIPWSGVRS